MKLDSAPAHLVGKKKKEEDLSLGRKVEVLGQH